MTATVRGRLFEAGWGAAAGYPGIVLDEQGEEVRGLAFSSDELAAHWQRHEFEGDGYERVPVSALLANGMRVDAYVYQLSGRRLATPLAYDRSTSTLLDAHSAPGYRASQSVA